MVLAEKTGGKIILYGRDNELSERRQRMCKECRVSSLDFIFGNGQAVCRPKQIKGEIPECLQYR